MMKHMIYVEPLYQHGCIWGYGVQVEFGAVFGELACPTAAANHFPALTDALAWAAGQLHIPCTENTADRVEIGASDEAYS